jgi:hypothetical protein
MKIGSPEVHVNKRLLVLGVGLATVGGVLGFAGMALGGAAVLAAVRDWVGQLETSPREVAVQKWQQAKQASIAGAHAWKEAVASDH